MRGACGCGVERRTNKEGFGTPIVIRYKPEKGQFWVVVVCVVCTRAGERMTDPGERERVGKKSANRRQILGEGRKKKEKPYHICNKDGELGKKGGTKGRGG